MICYPHHGMKLVVNGHYPSVSTLQTRLRPEVLVRSYGFFQLIVVFDKACRHAAFDLKERSSGHELQDALGETTSLVVTHDGDQAYGLTLGVPKRYAHVGIYVHLDQKVIVWEDDLDARGVNT